MSELELCAGSVKPLANLEQLLFVLANVQKCKRAKVLKTLFVRCVHVAFKSFNITNLLAKQYVL